MPRRTSNFVNERPAKDLPCWEETVCKIKISYPKHREYRRAEVQQISVMNSKQRQGYGAYDLDGDSITKLINQAVILAGGSPDA